MQTLSVDVMELTSWPSGRETPTDCDSLLELNHLVVQRHRQLQPTPTHESLYTRPNSVIVQCL